MIRLFVYALLGSGLMALHFKIEIGFVSFIAFVGCGLVVFAWIQRMNHRLRDAGLTRWYGILLFCAPMTLFVLLAHFKVIGAPLAIMLFILTQVPITFIRQKPRPNEMPAADPLK
jgi:uncharacterized membrane protein YhaH (DUF805 family)